MNSNQTAITATTPDRRRPCVARGGFTLVELLTAIGIIAVLVALLLLGIRHVSARAKTDKTRTVLAGLKGMLNEFEVKGGRMRMVDSPYYDPSSPGGWQVVRRELAPAHRIDNDNLASEVIKPEFERTRRVVQALLTMQANQTVMNNLPEDVRMKDPPRGGTPELPVTGPVLLDAWGNPILYAPRKAKPSPDPGNPQTTTPPADSTLRWGLGRKDPAIPYGPLFIKANPGVEHFYEPGDGKGMFVSAGPDGNFSTADDNIYSDDSGKVYTDVLTKKP